MMASPLDIASVSNATAPYFLGVDVGGTNIKIGLVDSDGHTLAFKTIPTEAQNGPEKACVRIAQCRDDILRELGIARGEIVAAGLGTPGPMCLRRGMLLTPTNLPSWHNFQARKHLSDRLGIPVSFINDANAAAYGEFWIGTGKEHSGLALLTLGTGVGGGLISEGRLINGVNSFGSELGHMIVNSDPDARLCNWGGGKGQLEAYASASAVALRGQELLGQEVQSKMHHTEDDPLTAYDVFKAAEVGDDLALQIVDETAFYLGVGITTAIHAIDPGLVVLGGAMNFGGQTSPIGRRFLQGIIAEFKERTFPNVFEGTTIDFAILGGNAGYVGAAGIALQEFGAA